MNTPQPIDFYFDFACPYAYLASTRLHALAAQTDSEIRLKPVLLGGIFRSLKQPQNMSTTLSPAKAKHNRLDLLRWASWLDVPLNAPLRHPNRTVEALRCLLAPPVEEQLRVVHAFYALYWEKSSDISDIDVLCACLDSLGLHAQDIAAAAKTQAVKDDLRRRTDDAVNVGVFGVPTFIVGDQLFFGQDRIDMVAKAAKGWAPRHDLITNFQFNQSTNEAQ